MRRIVLIGIFALFLHPCFGQYFQFSQYNFTPQRINPAQVASSNYAALSVIHRNQATDGGFHLTSNILNVCYPLISRAGKRWSGIGVTFMDDRSGQAGIFNTQEAGLSYALNVDLAKFQTISLGFKGLYQNRKIDLGGLHTGSQYVPDRGFNEALASGENSGQFNASFITFSAGLYWQQTDKEGTKLAYWGVSFFDFNKPENSFLGPESRLNSTLVGSVGFRTYSRRGLSVFPELLYTRSAGTNVLNAGVVTRYDLKPYSRQGLSYLNLITKYVIGRSGIVGLQLYKENFTVGISYDFPVFVKNVANTGAFEVAVELRRLVVPKKKNKTIGQKAILPVARRPVQKNRDPVHSDSATHKVDTADVKTVVKDDLSSRLKQKRDSIAAIAGIGAVKHEPLILERATLDFNFDFNSSAVNEKTAAYLTDLAQALKDNPTLRIRLVGHTDNVGSDKFNLKLSQYRAQKIKDYLVGQGIADSRITTEGKGMNEPLNDNGSAEKRALNRRVELTILYAE